MQLPEHAGSANYQTEYFCYSIQGEKLFIKGNIYKTDGITPNPNVIIYAYHTDHTGHYSKKGDEIGVQKWHGHFHGWCKTDQNGYYEILTIRPAPYPGRTFPVHIHARIKLPDNSAPFYINDFVFKDDSLVTAAYLNSLMYPGGNGIVDVAKDSAGTWNGLRNIVLPN